MNKFKEFLNRAKFKKVKTNTPSTFVTNKTTPKVVSSSTIGNYNPLSWIFDTQSYDSTINEAYKRIRNPIVNKFYEMYNGNSYPTEFLKSYIEIDNSSENISKFLTLLSQLNIRNVFTYEGKESIYGFVYTNQLFDRHSFFLNIYAENNTPEGTLFNSIVSKVHGNIKNNTIYNTRSTLSKAYIDYLKSIDGVANTDVVLLGVDSWDLSLLYNYNPFDLNNTILTIGVQSDDFNKLFFSKYAYATHQIPDTNMYIVDIAYTDLLKIELKISNSQISSSTVDNIDSIIKFMGNIS